MAEEIATLPKVPALPTKGRIGLTEALSVQEPFLTRKAELQPKIASAEGDVAKAQQAQAETLAAGKSQAMKQYGAEQEAAQKAYESKLEAEPLPAFVPTKETTQDIAGLFSVISVIGSIVGGSGKMAAQRAMGAMNGMMEGYRKGKSDQYKQERNQFDANFKTMIQKHSEFRKEMEDAVKLAATNKEAGFQAAELAATKAGSDIVKAQLRKGDLMGAYKLVDESQKGANEAVKLEQKARAEEAKAAQHRADMAQRERQHRETLAAKSGYGVGPSGLVSEFIGVNLPAKQAEPIIQSAAAIGEARELQDLVRKTPGIVGREGQARQFVNRYIDSALTGEALPSDQESGLSQDALLFAKRYASYLVNYERSLAPGARGFTVAFQNRFNNLMKQDQFNAQGMVDLLEDQQREVATQATRIDRNVNRQNLTRLGDDITGRSTSKSPAAPVQAQDYSADAQKRFGAYEPNKYNYGYEDGKFYREAK
jgi:hypothetical protein